jgi:nucleoside phosphorylase
LIHLNDAKKAFKRPKPRTKPRVRLGTIACVSSVIDSMEEKQAILERTDRHAVGLEMETFGLYHASRRLGGGIPCLALKAVSDFAALKNEKYRPYAAYMSATATAYVLRNLLPSLVR